MNKFVLRQEDQTQTYRSKHQTNQKDESNNMQITAILV